MAYREGGFRGGGGGRRPFRRSFGPREMHKVKCDECGKEAEVPFKPIKGKPVFCKECYFKKKGITPRDSSESKKSEEAEETEESEEAEEEVEEDMDEEDEE